MRCRGRIAFAVAMGLLGGAGVTASACSSTQTVYVHVEAGSDASRFDGGVADTSPVDAPRDTSSPQVDSGPSIEGGCSPVNGPACDIVLQNCSDTASGQKQECVAPLPDGGFSTQCQAITASEHLPLGRPCCPAADNPCLPGLECIGGDQCVGDAAPTSRCTPHCCDDGVCGTSDPEGFAGRCILSIVDGTSRELYKVCAYNQQCKPLHLGGQSCPAHFVCLVDDKFGTASCATLFNPDGGNGNPENAPCQAANECADGLMCFGQTCRLLCLTPGAMFDAGVIDGGPGYGGCPAAETCKVPLDSTRFPPWLSLCGP
jgi:hypothetical protein